VEDSVARTLKRATPEKKVWHKPPRQLPQLQQFFGGDHLTYRSRATLAALSRGELFALIDNEPRGKGD
jgi:hypothetical protein